MASSFFSSTRVARVAAGLGFLALLAGARTTAAQCIAQSACVCESDEANASFIATVVAIEIIPASATADEAMNATVRVDQLKVGDGRSTALVAGAEATMFSRAPDIEIGTTFFGVTRFLCQESDCKTEKVETLQFKSPLSSDGTVACGIEREARIGGADALALALAEDCQAQVDARIEDAGGDVSCHDVFGCSAAEGDAGDLPVLGAAIVLAVGAIAVARRRR